MTNILRRPVDLLLVLVFATFFIIAITIDYIQATYGSVLAEEDIVFGVWPPEVVVRWYAWFCENVDPLLGHNPMWYSTMAALSSFLYAPLYIVAIYAFIAEKEWIRIPVLLWGYGLLLTMVVIVREQLYGQFPTRDVTMFALSYGSYCVMPLLAMLRVLRSPVFKQTTPTPSSTRSTTSAGGSKKQNKKRKEQ